MRNLKAWKDFTFRIDPVLHRCFKQKAFDLDVPVAKLYRDVLALYAGYSTSKDDPRFTAEYMGGELPHIQERSDGYVAKIDVFRRLMEKK